MSGLSATFTALASEEIETDDAGGESVVGVGAGVAAFCAALLLFRQLVGDESIF